MKLPGTERHWKKQGRLLPQSFQRKCGLAILVLDSSLQNGERINWCCLKLCLLVIAALEN